MKREIQERITYIHSTPAKLKHSYKKQTKLMIKALKKIYKNRYDKLFNKLCNTYKTLKKQITNF